MAENFTSDEVEQAHEQALAENADHDVEVATQAEVQAQIEAAQEAGENADSKDEVKEAAFDEVEALSDQVQDQAEADRQAKESQPDETVDVEDQTVAVKAAEGYDNVTISVAIGEPVTLTQDPVDLPADVAELVLETPAAVSA